MSEQIRGDAVAEEAASHRQTIVPKWLRQGYVATNGIASAAELAIGVATGNVALATDGTHGTAEIFIGNEQMKDAHETGHVASKRRKRIYQALCGMSLLGSVVAGSEAVGAWDPGIQNETVIAIGAAASGMAFASASVAGVNIVRRTRRKYGGIMDGVHLRDDIEPTDKDVINHIVKLDMPSSAMAFGATALSLTNTILMSKGHAPIFEGRVEEVIGVASGMWGAYLFRPTEANLSHSHIEHDPRAETE